MVKFYLFFFSFLLLGSIYAQKDLLEKDKLSVDTLFFSDPNTALEISEKNIPKAIEINDTFYITYFLDQAGELNRMSGNYDKGIEQMLLCLRYKVNWEDLKDLSLTHNNIGKAYTRKGQYDFAIYHFVEALKLMETDKNLMGQGFYLNNIAAVYDLQHNYEKALDYYLQSLAIKKKIGDETGIAASYTNLGITYLNLGNYELSLDYNQKAYDIYKKYDNVSKTVRTINNVGEVMLKQNNVEGAYENFLLAYRYDAKNEDDFLRTTVLQNLAKIHLEKEQIDSANYYLAIAENKASALQSFKILKSIHLLKSDLEEKKGNFKEALKWSKIALSYNDSLVNEHNINAVIEITGKYEHEKHLRTISEDKLMIAHNEMELAQVKTKIIFWIALSIIFIISAIVLIILYFFKQKNTALLKGQLALIDERNTRLKNLNEKFKDELNRTQISLDEKEELLSNVFSQSKDTALPPELLTLSTRETEVLAYLALGWSDDQLAEKLFISKSTIKTHLRRIYSKLLVRGRAEAVAIAHKYNLIGSFSESES